MNKTILITFLGIIMCIGLASAFSGLGNGTANKPFQITNCTQIQEVNDAQEAYYVVMNDIDCSDTINWNSGSGFSSLSLSGGFNGNNHTISNLYGGSLFGSNSGYIYNVILDNVNVTKAGLVGQNGGYIVDCSVSGTINGVGMFDVGGLVGRNDGTIQYSHFTGTVMGGSGSGRAIGLNYGTIDHSYAIANVSGFYAAGLVGYDITNIINCYALGIVNGSSTASGGLVGYTEYPDDIENSFAAVQVISQSGEAGGLIGHYSGGVTDKGVFNSYWDTQVSGLQISDGGGEGKTTAELYSQATFNTWDFNQTWSIEEGVSYPTLLPRQCNANWNCTSHSGICTADRYKCTAVSDINNCNEPYTGDFSEFVITCGGGGGSFQETPAPILQVAVVPEKAKALNFGGMFEEFALIFQKLFSSPLDALKEVKVAGTTYWMEILTLAVIIGLVIYMATQGKTHKKKKGRRKKK